MKTARRITAICLVMILAITVSITSVCAYTDVPEDNSHYEAINVLSNIGIIQGYPNNTFGPDSSITRAEFTALITRVLGLGNIGGITETEFSDVPATHWAVSNIKLAYDLKIVAGFPDGTFKPDETVTYEQAVKMVVATLGYTVIANNKGGYPTGYITEASELGILDSAVVSDNKAPASRGLVAQILYNSLSVKIAETQGDDVTITDKSLLSNNLNLTKLEGTIDANEYTNLTYGLMSVGTGNISVDGVKLKLGDKFADFEDKLGQSVQVFYKKNASTGDNEIASIILQPGKNRILTIHSDNIESKDQGGFTYWDDPAHTRDPIDMTIPQNAKIIFNAKAITYDDLTTKNLIPDTGEITLVDSDNNNVYDVVFIESYTNYVVRLISDHTIYNELDTNNRLEIPASSLYNHIEITRNGQPATITSIQKGDVLSVAQSLDETYMEIKATSSPVTGQITEITGKENVTIGGKQYQYAKELMQYLDLNGISNLYTLGTKTTFYLDANGKIAWYLATTSSDNQINYGYLIDAGVEDGLESKISFQIYANSKVSVYDGAERIKVDGTTNMAYDDILQRLAENAQLTNKDIYDPVNPAAITDGYRESAKYSQIIKYTINKDNQIDFIDTITTEAGEPTDSLKVSDPSVYDKTGLTYNSSARNFENKVTVDSSTKVFFVPTNRSDENAYALKSISSFINNKSYILETFDLSVTKIGKVLILYGGSDDYKVTVSSPLIIVKSISEDSSQGEPLQKLTGINTQGSTVTYYADTLGALDNLKPGQVIRFGLNSSGRITTYNPISIEYDPNSSDPPAIPVSGADYNTPLRYKEYDSSSVLLANQGDNLSAYYRTLFATVVGADDTSILLSSNLPTEDVSQNQSTYAFTRSTKFIVFDPTKVNTSSVIQPLATQEEGLAMLIQYAQAGENASQVFTYSTNGQLTMVYFIKK